jgi:hypothetical protein
VPSGQDGRDELGIGMASAMKVADDGLDVERHAAVCDQQVVAVVFEE